MTRESLLWVFSRVQFSVWSFAATPGVAISSITTLQSLMRWSNWAVLATAKSISDSLEWFFGLVLGLLLLNFVGQVKTHTST